MKSYTDQQLVAECLKGNDRAWATLIDRYKQLIYSVPFKYHLSADEAGDIFQSVCLELYSHLPKLREQGALRGWLATVAAHQCYHWKRRARRHQDAEVELQATQQYEPPADLIEEVQQEQILREAIASLPPRCREMIRMLFFSEPPVSYAEVAKQLGLAAGSIGFIRGRCLAKLRQRLEELGFR